jgi:hypothetical protein
MNKRSLYAEARKCLKSVESELWRAAEIMADLQEAGDSLREIGAELGCSQETVRRYVEVWNRRVLSPRGDRPEFSKAMAAVRDRPPGRREVPQTPDRRAALAADLLKDKAVYDTPTVQKVVDRHVDRRLRQAAAEWNREKGIPTRTETAHNRRRQSVVFNRSFWNDVLWAMEKATRLLNEAGGELGRTGMPQDKSGAIIKAARALSKAADRFADRAATKAVGRAS